MSWEMYSGTSLSSPMASGYGLRISLLPTLIGHEIDTLWARNYPRPSCRTLRQARLLSSAFRGR